MTPNLATGTGDDFIYDPGVLGLVTALCRAAQLNGDRALVAQARDLFEQRVMPVWVPTMLDKPATQQSMRAASGLALIDAPDMPAPARFDRVEKFSGVQKFHLLGTFGHAYVLEMSTDFIRWNTISTNAPAPNGIVEFENLEAANVPRRFFRVIVRP